MKKIISLIFFATTLFSFCDGQNSARDFNDKLVDIQKDVIRKVQSYGSQGLKGSKENMIEANDYMKIKLEELKKGKNF